MARYGIGVAALGLFGPSLPVGTWAVNAAGCLLIGVAVSLVPTERVRLFAVLGGFATWASPACRLSAYSAETVALWMAGRPGWAVASAEGSVLVGVACVCLDLALGRAAAA